MLNGRTKRSNFRFISITISIILIVILSIFSVILFQNNEKTIRAYEQSYEDALNAKCEQTFSRVSNIACFFGTMSIATVEDEADEYYLNKQIEEKFALSSANEEYVKYLSIKKDDFFYVSNNNGIYLNKDTISDEVHSLGSIKNAEVFYTPKGNYSNNVYFLFEWSKYSTLYNDVSVGVNNYYFAKSQLSDNIEERQSFIVDSKGDIIFNDSHSLIYKNISDEFGLSLDNLTNDTVKVSVNGHKNYCTISKIADLDLYTVVLTDTSYYSNYFQVTVLIITLLLLVSLVGIYFLSVIIDYRTYRPILKIVENIKTLSPDIIDRQHLDEVEFINNQFDHLSELNSQLEEIIEEKHNEIRKNNAQILQSQICPHFIYNTLDAINWKSYNLYGQQNPISSCIGNISAILPYVMDVDDLTIPIKEEVNIIYEYINILNFRYGEEIDFKVDINKGILSERILKFCIQPVLENSVQHGLKLIKDKWQIKLKIYPEEDNIIVEVRDNGVGIPKEKIKDIQSRIEDEEDVSVLHIGLKNINRRLKLLYGEDCGLTLTNARGGGAICRMKMKRNAKGD